MPQVKARKKPRRKKATTEHCSFAIEVKDWRPSYSVRLEEGRHVSPSYQHSLHLDIKGVVVEPAKYAGQEMEATFVGDQDMLELPKPGMTEWKPLGVATLTWRGKERSLIAGLPFECMHTVLSMLEAKRFKYVYLWGTGLHRGSSSIKSVHFVKEYDPEDLS